jgi:hypothetical protein
VEEVEALHVRAIAEGKDTYADPTTGCDVFTSAYLLRGGTCCESGCRHCPYGSSNVEPTKGGPEGPGHSEKGRTEP